MLTDALLVHRRRRAAPLLLAPFFAFVSMSAALAGCGAAPLDGDGADDASSARKKAEVAAPEPTAAPGHVLRSHVDRALVQGPSWLLQRVVPREVVKNGAFVGWQIVGMPEEWANVGLKLGDVVTRVNGASIEKPDDLWKAWVTLMAAPELKIAYERDGAAKELVVPIDGAPTLTEATLQSKMGAAQGERRSSTSRRQETIVIPGDDPTPSGPDYSAP